MKRRKDEEVPTSEDQLEGGPDESRPKKSPKKSSSTNKSARRLFSDEGAKSSDDDDDNDGEEYDEDDYDEDDDVDHSTASATGRRTFDSRKGRNLRKGTSEKSSTQSRSTLERLQVVDTLLGEAQDLLYAAAEAQALGRLKMANSYLVLAHARLIGVGKRSDRQLLLRLGTPARGNDFIKPDQEHGPQEEDGEHSEKTEKSEEVDKVESPADNASKLENPETKDESKDNVTKKESNALKEESIGPESVKDENKNEIISSEGSAIEKSEKEADVSNPSKTETVGKETESVPTKVDINDDVVDSPTKKETKKEIKEEKEKTVDDTKTEDASDLKTLAIHTTSDGKAEDTTEVETGKSNETSDVVSGSAEKEFPETAKEKGTEGKDDDEAQTLALASLMPAGVTLDAAMMEHLRKAALELHEKRTGTGGSKEAEEEKSKAPMAWTDEEKKLCYDAVEKYGRTKVSEITKAVGTRTEQQVVAHLRNVFDKARVSRELDHELGEENENA